MNPTTLARRMRGPARSSLATLALVAASVPSHATSVIPMTVVDLLSHSDAIVAGQVQSVVDGFDACGLPYMEVTIKVSDTIRGQKAETYTFRQLASRSRARRPMATVTSAARQAADLAEERVGDRVHALESKSTGFQTTVGLGQGKMSLANGVAMNAYDNGTLFRDVKVNRGLLDSSE